MEVTVLNTTDTEIDSGNEHDFFLQVEQDGQWYDLEERGDFSNTTEAYIFEKGTPREMTFQWASRYGSLDTGHYRAVKWFFEFHRNETEQGKRVVDFALAVEFDIK